MNAPYDWRPHDYEGVWRHGPAWARPFVAAAPWLTAGLALLMLLWARDTLTAAAGTDFELPAGALQAEDATGPTLVLIPAPTTEDGAQSGTIAFFDDARYPLGDGAVSDALAARLTALFSGSHAETLLLLADRRVSTGDVMKIVAAARAAGARRVRIAAKGD